MLRRVLAGLANSAPDGARCAAKAFCLGQLLTTPRRLTPSALLPPRCEYSIELKLTKKPVGGAAALPAAPVPPHTPDGGRLEVPAQQTAAFLEVTATGEGMVICHGVPLLGDPLRRSAVDACERLVASSGTRVPYWLSIPPVLAQQLVAEVTSLKAVAPTIDLATLPVRLA